MHRFKRLLWLSALATAGVGCASSDALDSDEANDGGKPGDGDDAVNATGGSPDDDPGNSGGSKASGGDFASGGSAESGGSSSSGGATGGQDAAGGSDTGGSDTGGSNTGGTATGGSNPGTGGTTSTGGTTGTGGTPAVSGCEDYVDRSDPDADRQVDWGFGITSSSERCMIVAVGQVVVYEGNFGSHPLGPGDGNSPNPFASLVQSQSTATVTFSNAGTFGFECGNHATMRGAVRAVFF